MCAALAVSLALSCALVGAEPGPAQWERPGPNLARGRSYTLQPDPNYALCLDPDDATQLTDGTYSEGYFWTQKSTVGWQGGANPRIVVDLARVQPICGASYHTAAGRAGVEWPTAVLVLVSDDGHTWYRAGDLVAQGHEPAPTEDYALHRYWTDRWACHGRFVAFVVSSPGPYIFCDELEVYGGPEALLSQAPSGKPLASLDEAVLRDLYVTQVVRREVGALRDQIAVAAIAPAARAGLLARLSAAEAGLDDLDATDARPSLPLGAADRRVLAVRAALWRELGRPLLRGWQTNRWDPLTLSQEPPAGSPAPTVQFSLLRGEIRGEVLNITSAADQELRLAVTLEGLPGGLRPPWLTVRSVAWTITKGGGAVACALPECADGVVTVPAGITRQIWFSVDSTTVPPGDYHGAVVLTTDGQAPLRVPFGLRVSRLAMPAKLSLSLGGWDYTDGPGRGVTADNLANVVAFLREYGVDAPWATGAVMPMGTYDGAGNLVQRPDTARMDAWLARWPGARYYCVFNSVETAVPDTAAGRQRVASWIRFWVDHLRQRGIEPAKLLLLLLDEPHEAAQDQIAISWTRVVRQTAPEVTVFEDPTWDDPRQATPELLSLATMLCPNRPMWQANRAAFEAVYPAQAAAGRQLALYSCSGPVRSLDPYSYHLLQAWDCFRLGALHEAFWAFGDNGGGSAWQEGQAAGTCYCPQFLDARGCVTSKHMEAIREGRFDFEYLTLLRAAVQAAQRRGVPWGGAATLLTEAPRRVLAATGAEGLTWSSTKDRSLADRTRRELFTALESLSP